MTVRISLGLSKCILSLLHLFLGRAGLLPHGDLLLQLRCSIGDLLLQRPENGFRLLDGLLLQPQNVALAGVPEQHRGLQEGSALTRCFSMYSSFPSTSA